MKPAVEKPGPESGQIEYGAKYCTGEEKFSASNNNCVGGGGVKTDSRKGPEEVAAESRAKATNLSAVLSGCGVGPYSVATTVESATKKTMVVVEVAASSSASGSAAGGPEEDEVACVGTPKGGEKASKAHVDTGAGAAKKTSFAKNNDKCDTPAKEIIVSSSRADNGRIFALIYFFL